MRGDLRRRRPVAAAELLQVGRTVHVRLDTAARGAGHVVSFVTLDPEPEELSDAVDHLWAAQVEGILAIAPVRPKTRQRAVFRRSAFTSTMNWAASDAAWKAPCACSRAAVGWP